MTRDDVFEKLVQNRDAIHKFGVRRLGLFGSCARNEATEKSDLDFLVDLEHVKFDIYMDLKFFLEDLFGKKVDLVLADSLKPRLKPYVMKDVIYAEGL